MATSSSSGVRGAFPLTGALATALACTAAPAGAHGRVGVGGVFDLAPPLALYPSSPVPYPAVVGSPGGVPPPAWESGRHEWRRDPWGRHILVWVPTHLR